MWVLGYAGLPPPRGVPWATLAVTPTAKSKPKNMMKSIKGKQAASSVSQDKPGRVQDLGRGSCSKSKLQSPGSGSSSETDRTVNIHTISEETGHHSGGSGGVAWQHFGTPKEVPEVLSSAANEPGGSSNPGTSSGGVDDLDQKHPDGESVVPQLTRAQKRNARKKLARQVTRDASGSSGAGAKRPRSEGTPPSVAAAEGLKKPRTDRLSGSFASAVRGEKLAVVRASYPSSKLSLADVDHLQINILGRIDSTPAGESLPAIVGSTLVRGALVVQCDDSATADWVRRSFHGNSEVMGDEELIVMSAKDLPKPCKVALRTKDAYTKDHGVFLRRIARLNPGLKSEEWRVLQVTVEQRSSRWILEVEEEDVEAIRQANYGALTGLDRGVFKILSDPNKKIHAVVDEMEVAGGDSPDAASEVSTVVSGSLTGGSL